MSLIGKNNPPLTPEELQRVIDWQNIRNKFLKEWRIKTFNDVDIDTKKLLEKTVNSIRDHASPDDLAGSIKELRGEQILDANGRPYNHIEEVNTAKNSLLKSIKRLKFKMADKNFNPQEFKIYENYLKDLSDLKDNLILKQKIK